MGWECNFPVECPLQKFVRILMSEEFWEGIKKSKEAEAIKLDAANAHVQGGMTADVTWAVDDAIELVRKKVKQLLEEVMK